MTRAQQRLQDIEMWLSYYEGGWFDRNENHIRRLKRERRLIGAVCGIELE